MLTLHAMDILRDKFLSRSDEDWVIVEVEDLNYQFEHPQWPLSKANDLHTQAQVGYLSGVMDLEREDRIQVMELVLGYPLQYVLGEWFPGIAEPLEPDNYPGPSLKDVRFTRWQTSVMLEYYINGNGYELNERLGYTSKTAIDQKERDQKATQKQADADAELSSRATA